MTISLRTTLPFAALFLLPLGALQAKEPAPEITVVAPTDPAVRSWSTRVGREIDRTMRYPRTLATANQPEGVVDVTFRCSEDGRPSEVAVLRSSGSRRLDRASLAAIKDIRSLHPLPAGIDHGQVYHAQMLFAVDDGTGSARERLAAMRSKGDRNNDALMQRRGASAVASVVTLMPTAALR